MTLKSPNVLLLVLDTQRLDRLSLYGYERQTTPAIDEFAQGATVFDWGISTAQWTVPSHASMFTGLYPTVHQTNQTNTALSDEIPTLAELLGQNGYHTVGFCNNPLVGVLDNGLKRGFDRFYNYSGYVPTVPGPRDKRRPLARFKRKPGVEKVLSQFTNLLERQFGHSSLLLWFSMQEWFVPFWTLTGRFKGDTKQSLHDVADYLRYHSATHKDEPFFMFINMMETHLPYFPPRRMEEQWVPYLKRDREARDFLKRFNVQSYRWVAPMIEPFTPLQERVLSDMYDAEIAYQDTQLRRVFRHLERSGELENTMVIIVSDHGESHGDHDFMGHAFVIYNELVHVPLIIHYPAMFPAGQRIEKTVSTRRLFHTILEAAGIPYEGFGHTVHELSLARTVEDKDPDDEVVVSEAYPPLNFIEVMKLNNPEAIDPFRVRMMRRAIYDGGYKLMTVDDRPDEMFDVHGDPREMRNLLDNPIGYENDLLRLEKMLEEYVVLAEAHRDGTAAGKEIDLSDNPELLDRLRGLGYIE
jgi:uncharacterized sulfatase